VKRAVLCLALVVTLGILVAPTSMACTLWDGCVEADQREGGFGYYYDKTRRAFYADESTNGTETVDGVTVQ
jgi:hypothetical protein